MIVFDHVSKTYPNGYQALKDINLTIEQGEFVAIIGLSGAGKSTLIRTINRMPVSYTHLDVYKRQVLNYFGVDLMAKIQNLLVIVLVISLAMFAVFGLPQVDLAAYFSNADGLFMTDGIGGFLTAVAYLGFATGGATVILGVSAE